MSNPTYQFAQESDLAIQWQLRRNCSVTPAQLGRLYFSLCALSLGIGLFFWLQGATLVLAFAGVEIALVGVAFWPMQGMRRMVSGFHCKVQVLLLSVNPPDAVSEQSSHVSGRGSNQSRVTTV